MPAPIIYGTLSSPAISDDENEVESRPLSWPGAVKSRRASAGQEISQRRHSTSAVPENAIVSGVADLKRTKDRTDPKRILCKGDLRAGGQWGCGRSFSRADALRRHLQSEAGRICIKPLRDEEMVEQQRVWQAQRQIYTSQPLQLRETVTNLSSDNVKSPLQSSISWKDDLIDYTSYRGGSGNPRHGGQKQVTSAQEQSPALSISGYSKDAVGNHMLPASLLAKSPALAETDWVPETDQDDLYNADVDLPQNSPHTPAPPFPHLPRHTPLKSDPPSINIDFAPTAARSGFKQPTFPYTDAPNPPARGLCGRSPSHSSVIPPRILPEQFPDKNQNNFSLGTNGCSGGSMSGMPAPEAFPQLPTNGINNMQVATPSSNFNTLQSPSYLYADGGINYSDLRGADSLQGLQEQVSTDYTNLDLQMDMDFGLGWEAIHHDFGEGQQIELFDGLFFGGEQGGRGGPQTSTPIIKIDYSPAPNNTLRSAFEKKWPMDIDVLPEKAVYPVPLLSSELECHRSRALSNINDDLGVSRLSQQQLSKGDDMPFTDSGYASAPNHNYPSNIWTPADKPGGMDPEHPTSSTGKNGDDTKTVYSAATTIMPAIARKSLFDICSDIYNRLGRNINHRNWKSISKNIPSLIKAFALKLGSDTLNELNLRAMHFIHKHHQEIATQLRLLFRPEYEDEPETHRDTSDAMSLLDKMSMWRRSLGKDHTEANVFDLFEGVEEDENEDPDLSAYSKVIVNSVAYEWLIANLVKESSFHWDEAQPRIMVDQIRQKILARLPTGTISKKQAPCSHKVSFELPWRPLESRLEEERVQRGFITFGRAIADSVVATCSSTDQVQLTTVKQYMDQTWPSGGRGLLEALQEAIDGTQRDSVCVTLPDKTEIEAILYDSYLIVSVAGPAYSIAERGEQLAWLAAALLPPNPRFAVYTTPSLRSTTEHTPSKTYEHRWIIDPCKETIGETSDLTALSTQNWKGELHGPVIVRGFPTVLRPERCPGVEMSPETLFDLIRTPKLEVNGGRILLQGLGKTLELFRQKKEVLVWHILGSSHEACVCRHYLPREDDDDTLHFVNLAEVWQHRHILGDCASARMSFGNSEPHVQLCRSEEAPEISIGSVEASSPSNNSLREASDATLRSGIITDSLDSDMLSISNWSEDTFNESLDPGDAMFPIIDTVARRLLSEYQTSIPRVGSSGGATKCMFSEGNVSPRENNNKMIWVRQQQPTTSQGHNLYQTQYGAPQHGTQYGMPLIQAAAMAAAAGASGSSHPYSTSSYPSLPQSSPRMATVNASSASSSTKRPGVEEENDSDDENSTRKPKPKRLKRDNSGRGQRLLACPFWKVDPSKHRGCFRKKLDMISRVKQHLARNHTPTFYCERCFAIFPEEESHRTHMRDETESCRWDPSARLDGISHRQHRELSRKSKPDLPESEKWFAIWDILFPDHPRPSSPYMDPDLSEDFCRFREYSQNRGPAILAEELRTRNLVLMSQDGTESCLQMAITRGFNTLFEEWLSNHASSSRLSASSGYPPSSSRPERNNGPSRLMRNQAPPSSFADSGVEIRSQMPSSRSREDASFSSYAHVRPVPQSVEVLNEWQSGTENFNVDSAASHFQNTDLNLLQSFGDSFPHVAASHGHLAQDDGGHFDAGSFDDGFNHVQSKDIDELLSEILEDAQPMERPDYQ
ncbi:hypothetical protein DL765_000420 [Monosporascus sp. GIB2]|nr:hypothetical protein DL765_000420 [Monosporascus sp. GIB2]